MTHAKDQAQWPLWVFWSGIFLLGVIFAWTNALTITADLTRNEVVFETWHPYVWEYSSFLSTFILYFGIYWLAKKASLLSPNWLRNLCIHLLASIIFSLLHVLFMVWFRQMIYLLLESQYDFGDWMIEWLYEYRKDIITYFIFLLTVYAFQYFAQPKQREQSDTQLNKLEVKNKQGVFWIELAAISTIESGGNYVYIHTKEQVLPMRSTMAQVEKQLESQNFIRIHRSYLVNFEHCKSIKNLSANSSELVLLNGKTVPVSKKYRSHLLAAFDQTRFNSAKIKT